jgi:hypothetical protein
MQEQVLSHRFRQGDKMRPFAPMPEQRRKRDSSQVRQHRLISPFADNRYPEHRPGQCSYSGEPVGDMYMQDRYGIPSPIKKKEHIEAKNQCVEISENERGDSRKVSPGCLLRVEFRMLAVARLIARFLLCLYPPVFFLYPEFLQDGFKGGQAKNGTPTVHFLRCNRNVMSPGHDNAIDAG